MRRKLADLPGGGAQFLPSECRRGTFSLGRNLASGVKALYGSAYARSWNLPLLRVARPGRPRYLRGMQSDSRPARCAPTRPLSSGRRVCQ